MTFNNSLPGLRRFVSRPRRRSALFGAAFSLLALSAAAQTSDQTIVVVGAGAERRSFDAPYAVGVVDADTLRSAGPMVNLSAALARVPGLTVNLRNNYAQDLQVSSRGPAAHPPSGA